MRKRVFALFVFLFFSKFYPSMIIDGGGNILELSETGSLWIEDNSQLTLKDLTLKNLSGERLVMGGPDSVLVLHDVFVCLDGNYSFTQGAILFESAVEFRGTHTFAYTSDMTSTITSCATLTFDTCLTFSYNPASARRKNDVRELIEFRDTTARLFLKGVTLHATTTGMHIRGGTIIADHTNTVEADGTTVSDGIIFGDNLDATYTVSLIEFPSATIRAENVNEPNAYVAWLTA
ncbi:hypothetical protein KAW80_03690 [Candidatus Babeliales bacterium]|nr:hypothetical protein [Candidatus Babeliales bacterium]